MGSDVDVAEQFEKHLNSPMQTWLFGAGVSYTSNIPLMVPLTTRTIELAIKDKFKNDKNARKIIKFIQNDIPENANIEEFLTHLGDFISLAERSRDNKVAMGEEKFTKIKITEVHLALLRIIAEIIRWGYKTSDGEEEIGKNGKSIVTVDAHKKFVEAVFGRGRAGLDILRQPIEFFTTNYDTLLEDALAINQIKFLDGFIGGGVGFWSAKNYENHVNERAIVTKLHGSIDWYRPQESPSPLLRIRDGDTYPGEGGSVMIYPQATKYMNTQRDPFAELFQRFRNRLVQGTDQVLLVCGYSFGDDHINAEIEIALSAPKRQLTLVVFSGEIDNKLPKTLETWRKQRSWKNRVFIASPKGLYHGDNDPYFTLSDDETRSWWTFEGATKIFAEGLPRDIQEAIE